MDKKSTYKVWRSSFRTANSIHQIWKLQAEWLFHSASIILDKALKAKESIAIIEPPKDIIKKGDSYYDIILDDASMNQALLLIGYGIENLLKGLWVNKNNPNKEQVESDRINSRIATHNLSELAKEIGLDLSEEEISTLNVFREIIEWRGRYPIPLNVTDYANSKREGYSKLLSGFTKTKIPKELNSILEKISNHK